MGVNIEMLRCWHFFLSPAKNVILYLVQMITGELITEYTPRCHNLENSHKAVTINDRQPNGKAVGKIKRNRNEGNSKLLSHSIR